MDKDVVHVYMEYYSVIEKKQRMPFAAIRIQLEIKGTLPSFQVHLTCGLLQTQNQSCRGLAQKYFRVTKRGLMSVDE